MPSGRPVSGAVFAALICLGLLSGCTAKHYRNQADNNVYRIVQQVEHQLFGKTNEFSIDTPYSSRKPKEILPDELIRDRMMTNQRFLTIQDALNLAINNSRRFQTERERLYLTALTLTGEKHQFRPQFFARSSPTFLRSSDGQKSFTLGTDAGVSQLFKSGGSLGITLANDLLRYYTGDPARTLVSILSVNLAQPLLRGFGRNNPEVENLTQAERNVAYAVRNFSFFQDSFALEIASDYFDLLAQKDVIRNRYTNYLGRVTATSRLDARAKDRERISDVDQARQSELNAQNNYVNAVAQFRNSLAQFKIKLGLPVGERVSLDDSALEELEERGLVPVSLDTVEAFEFAVRYQLPLLNAIDQFEDGKRKVRVAKDRFKPDLNLSARASMDSERPTDYTRFNPNEYQASAGLSLELPLDRQRERNSYRATLISFESQLRSLTLSLDTVRENVERGLRTLNQRRQTYEIQRNALELANRRVASSNMRLEAGLGEVRDLIESQDAQIAAQNAVTSALVSYQEARLQLMLDMGALKTDMPKFWLVDHLASLPLSSPPEKPRPASGLEAIVPPEQSFIE